MDFKEMKWQSEEQEHNNTLMLRFGIYGKENFINYRKNIGFSHPKKIICLNNLLESYVDVQKTQKEILQTVINSDIPLTVSQISQVTNTNTKAALYHLLNLARKGRINKTSGRSPALWANLNEPLMNNKEKILRVLANSKLSALEICNILNLDVKYTLQMLKSLKDEGLIMCYDSHPRIWELHKLS